MLDTAGLIDLETRLGRRELPAARRGADRGRGRLGHGRRGQPLSRLPGRLFGGEPGALPSEDPRGDGRAGRAADADHRAPSATTSSPLFYEELAALTNSHKVLPMNSGAEAVETAIKAVRKWGYEVKGVPEGQAEIIVCADNFHGRTIGDRRLLDRSGRARRLRAVRAGLPGGAVRRRRGAGGGDHAEHRRRSWSSRSRARPG